MPLLLLTRPAPAAERFREELRTSPEISECDIFVSPMLRISPTGLPAPHQPARSLIFTSRNAVELYTGPTDLPAWVVGDRTAKFARLKGMPIAGIAPNAETLLSLLPDMMPQPVWYVRGRHVAGALSEALLKRGVTCLPWILYEQLPQALSTQAQAAIRHVQSLILPVFSPRTARLLAQELCLIDTFPKLWVVAISSNVAEVFAENSKFHQMSVADAPTSDAMVKTIAKVVNQVRLLERKRPLP